MLLVGHTFLAQFASLLSPAHDLLFQTQQSVQSDQKFPLQPENMYSAPLRQCDQQHLQLLFGNGSDKRDSGVMGCNNEKNNSAYVQPLLLITCTSQLSVQFENERDHWSKLRNQCQLPLGSEITSPETVMFD